MYSTFKHMKVSGLAVVVPDHVIDIDSELSYFDNNPKMLARNKKILGLGTRYVIPDGCNATVTDLCAAAARKLIDEMNIDINELDAIISVIQKPDYMFPNSACVLHGMLNLPESCAAFDINHGCAGYAYGLWVAGGMIDSGACKKILLLAGDNVVKLKYPTRNDKDDILFGDAGSATLIEYSADATPSFFNVRADGKGGDTLITPFGGQRITLSEELINATIVNKEGWEMDLVNMHMDGSAVFAFTVSKVPASITELMSYAKATYDDIDFFVLHQANKQIVDAVVAKAGIPVDKCSSETFSKYGNQSTATLPGVIAHLLYDKISKGSMRLLLSGYGVGLAWCSAVVDFNNVHCTGVSVQNFDHIRSREDEIKYWKAKITGQPSDD